MPWTVPDWLDHEPQLDCYAVLGRPRFDRDRDAVLQAIKDAKQSIEDAKVQVARRLRSSSRAVTAEDYEFHATEIPGIARACCLAPGAQPGGDEQPAG